MLRYDLSILGIVLLSLLLSACNASFDTSLVHSRIQSTAVFSSSDLITLGRAIFNDTRLSEPEGVSCASCHQPEKAFTGNNNSPFEAVAKGSLPDRFGGRNSPSCQYASFSPEFAFLSRQGAEGLLMSYPAGGQFWDGRAKNLEEQAKGPFLNALEMNNPNKESVIAKIADGSYAELFLRVFGEDALSDTERAFDRVADALAGFEKSAELNPFRSRFDDFLRGQGPLSALEAKGFELFKDPQKGNCISCHAGQVDSKNPRDWLFTDFTYDALAVPRNMQIPANGVMEYFDLGFCQRNGLEEILPADLAQESLCGTFKVPTLRNVALTAPYMHNGVFKTLAEVVKFYVTRDTNPELWYPKDASGRVLKYNDLPERYHANVNTKEPPYDRKRGEEPRLNDSEIEAVVAFLKTLTDR